MRKFMLLCGLTVLLLTGCGQKAIEEASGVSVDEQSGTVTIKGEDGQAVTIKAEDGGTTAPEGFPLPIMPGTKVTSGSKLTVNGKNAYTVALSFKGEAKPVADFYEAALRENGVSDAFRADMSTDEEDNATLSGQAEAGTAYIFIQSLKPSKEGTVAISWSEN